MALVAYDYSDSSDIEDDACEPVNNSTKESIPESSLIKEHNTAVLFSLLPQPTSKKSDFIEEDDEFLHKKETTINILKPKAKITVPSLSDFKDVKQETQSKPRLTTGKKSGLLSILPQPKNISTVTVKSLIPQVVSQKPKGDTAKKKESLPLSIKMKDTATKSLGIDYSDESEDDEDHNDFFSINKKIEILEAEPPIDIVSKESAVSIQNTQEKPPKPLESYFKESNIEMTADFTTESVSEHQGQEESSSSYGHLNNVEDAVVNNVALDDEAILKLCGARGKRKREDIQIVDVNQQEVLADAREWLLKGLMDDTTKRVSSSKKKGNEPTSQQKRKHQITYLAHQAKANEAELQNQWANNRMTKRKTQSKYGF